MNTKEIGELRRRIRKDRTGITHIYGCYVNGSKEIVSEFRQSVAIMPENESEKYFANLRRVFSGTIGRNLIDINFKTSQVAGSPEHKLLMDMRNKGLENEELRRSFFQKIIESVSMEDSFLILAANDTYDVPFKSKDDFVQSDNSDEVFTYFLCSVSPVKQTKATLHYVPEEKTFQDGAMMQVVQAPQLGFVFPAFDSRSTNIYNALYYTKDVKTTQQEFIDALFHTAVPKPAAEQKKDFEAVLADSLDDECNMDVLQTVHDQLCQRIELHKESKVPEALVIQKEDIEDMLSECGVTEEHLAKFRVEFDEAFGTDANVHPRNIIDPKRFEVKTPDVSIKVDPTRTDLIETRTLGGVKYIMICADENIEVNGVSIHIQKDDKA